MKQFFVELAAKTIHDNKEGCFGDKRHAKGRPLGLERCFGTYIESRDGIFCEQTISAGSGFSRHRFLAGSCRLFRPTRERRAVLQLPGVPPDPRPNTPKTAKKIEFYRIL
jgi:hypothetical protein